MDKIIELGGKGLLIPAVLSVLVLYAIRGLFGLHGQRSQHRKEFLELWDSARSQDDFWLEVIVKHLVGVYLPTRVIRLALAQPNRGEALFELAELWPLWRYNPEAQKVDWLSKRHRALTKHKAGRPAILFAYFACASIAVVSGVAAANFCPSTFSGWVFGSFAVLMIVAAVSCALYDNTIEIAIAVGDDWMDRINQSAGNGNSG
ncbi:MAG: hypothetical protein WAZ48_06080 [Lysobacteraceae bacterium]